MTGTNQQIIIDCRTLGTQLPIYQVARTYNPSVNDHVPWFVLKGARIAIDAPPSYGADAKINIYAHDTDALAAAEQIKYKTRTFNDRKGEIAYDGTLIQDSYDFRVQVNSCADLEMILKTFTRFAE